jgi:nitrogen fixation protein NifU and related proteins
MPAGASTAFLRHAERPLHLGSLDTPSGRATVVGQCGDSIEICIQVERGILSEVRVLPHGCVYTTACSSAMASLACGRTLDEALALDPEQVVYELDGLPADHMHCARLAVNGLGEAIGAYYRNLVETSAQ